MEGGECRRDGEGIRGPAGGCKGTVANETVGGRGVDDPVEEAPVWVKWGGEGRQKEMKEGRLGGWAREETQG